MTGERHALLSQARFPFGRTPVSPGDVRVEEVGVNPLDRRRVDVAVDLTPCLEPLSIELVVVGPEGDELASTLALDSREWMLDRVLHLRQDARPGPHTLHIGVFHGDHLVARAARTFEFPPPAQPEEQTDQTRPES